MYQRFPHPVINGSLYSGSLGPVLRVTWSLLRPGHYAIQRLYRALCVNGLNLSACPMSLPYLRRAPSWRYQTKSDHISNDMVV